MIICSDSRFAAIAVSRSNAMIMPFEPNSSRSRDAGMVAAAKPFFLWTSSHGDRKTLVRNHAD